MTVWHLKGQHKDLNKNESYQINQKTTGLSCVTSNYQIGSYILDVLLFAGHE